MSQYKLMFDLKINVGHCDLYFMVQWFCRISWRLFDVWASYPNIWFKINVGHCDRYFMGQWICLISWRLFDICTILWDYESVWPDVRLKNKCWSLWPVFHGPVILPYILEDWLMYEHHTSGLWVSVTHISWSSDFALHLEDYLLHEHHTLG